MTLLTFRLQALHGFVDNEVESARAEAARRQNALLTARDIIHASQKRLEQLSPAHAASAAKVAAVAAQASRDLLEAEMGPDPGSSTRIGISFAAIPAILAALARCGKVTQHSGQTLLTPDIEPTAAAHASAILDHTEAPTRHTQGTVAEMDQAAMALDLASMAVDVSAMADAMRVEELNGGGGGGSEDRRDMLRRPFKPKKAVWASVSKKQIALMSKEEKESHECYQGGLLAG